MSSKPQAIQAKQSSADLIAEHSSSSSFSLCEVPEGVSYSTHPTERASHCHSLKRSPWDSGCSFCLLAQTGAHLPPAEAPAQAACTRSFH